MSWNPRDTERALLLLNAQERSEQDSRVGRPFYCFKDRGSCQYPSSYNPDAIPSIQAPTPLVVGGLELLFLNSCQHANPGRSEPTQVVPPSARGLTKTLRNGASDEIRTRDLFFTKEVLCP